ncbi:putative GTP-binding protein EngB [Candidatus Kinetoplastibacterium sorsogonicusi]|uniref:Probable GTP-binding protein EngB n=1 Tax=Candidatus Kinetoplastidibacterium kentomonadis TaxID=1576550 RepID=A0A3Q8F427_9PROT|nr:ribosome biogenesis GTP-binding protein YihA/YsxC [Candidatus Kinetoplastibacterium sorsogonicusi]AWD32769.1 putative GTP-binding protein EngB [Candidatus Kinetoplastibacterium sorsogonicusi]
MSLLNNTIFFKSESKIENLPKDCLPEICFVGRSNVGKSTIINTLTNKKKLAFSSKLPGRTRLINLFKVNDLKNYTLCYLVDLPGYGYASVSNNIKQNWTNILNSYIHRNSILCIVLILDIRRGLTDLDKLLINYINNSNCFKLVLINKIDKLSHEKRISKIKNIKQQLIKLNLFDTLEFSSTKKIGIDNTNQYLEKIILKKLNKI